MEGLEEHDRVTQIRRIGSVLRVGIPRPVDVAVRQRRDRSRGHVGRDIGARGRKWVVEVVEPEVLLRAIDEEQQDDRDTCCGAHEAHPLGSHDLTDIGLERLRAGLVGGYGSVGEVEELPQGRLI